MIRCPWYEGKPLYEKYHDEEWGMPVFDDDKLFECLILELFQAGLSWWIILQKRESFRRAFNNFDVNVITKYTEDKIEELLKDKNIIRHRKKIEATINNAQRFKEVQTEYGSFSNYLWAWVNNKPIVNFPETIEDIPTQTRLSDDIAKDLKCRGFQFLGTKTIYAYLQAVGVINNHLKKCSFSTYSMK